MSDGWPQRPRGTFAVKARSEHFVDEGRLEDLRSLDVAGRLRVRVNAYLPVNFTDEKDPSWYRGFEPHQVLGPRLRVAGVKFFLDHEWGTQFHWEQRELNAYVLAAHRHGWQVSAHAVSAEAHDQILDAVARAQVTTPRSNARHRVEHVIQLRDDQLLRLRELGMIASIQPGLPGDQAKEGGFRALAARGEDRWVARWRDLLDSGVRTVGSTDMPWLVLDLVGAPTAPPHASALEAVHQAVTRQTYSGRRPEPQELAQRLTVEQALRLFTAEAAYATFEEDRKGTVSVGKQADLVVLTADPTAVPVDALLHLRVVTTMVAGRVEFCADGVRC